MFVCVKGYYSITMIFQIFLTCSFITLFVDGQRFAKFIEPQPQPRMGYSTSIIHTNPKSNDLQSESSVRVNFHPQQEGTVRSNVGRGADKYLQTNNNVPNKNFYPRAMFDNNQKDTNSFNVGYNISFSNTDGGNKRRKQAYTRANNKKLENAEVITGKSKKNEKVRAPTMSIDQSPQEFVSNAFLKQKQIRLTSSPISTKGSASSGKPLNPVKEYASSFQSQSPKFTYNTQQNIFRDVIKATKPDPIQLGQEFKAAYQTSGRWNNLGNGLEISKSIEPHISEQNYGTQFNARYTNTKATMHDQPRTFNHDSALQNSQSFDFSNAHGEILLNENDSPNDNFSEGSEQYTHRTKKFEAYDPSSNRNIEDNFHNQQFSELNNINIEAHIPARLRGVKPLPLDTSLLKDPVLMTDFREAPNDPRVIPIRFDISNLEKAMKEQLTQIQNNYPVQQKPYLNAPMPDSSQTGGLTYEDHDSAGSQNDFRAYGKPEPVDTSQYKTGYYDRHRSDFDSDIYKIVSMRPPPVGQNIRY